MADTINVNINQPGLAVNTKKINAIVYLILVILLGFIGIHRFYRGSIGMGVLYIFTGGLFGIGWFIDFILAIVYCTQMDPYQQITFVNKKYARYQPQYQQYQQYQQQPPQPPQYPQQYQ